MLLQRTPVGLFCPAGDFYVDPLRGVHRAVVTHAHSDHARPGSQRYLAAEPSKHLLRMRLGPDATIKTMPYGQSLTVNSVQIRFYPAGHMLGSAQVRLEHKGEVAVVSGDYKLGDDATCDSWEPVACHLFVSESTFCLPVYRWRPQTEIFAEINAWWRDSAQQGKCCVLYGYAVGKSQRLLAGLDEGIGPVYTHGAVQRGVEVYRATGVQLPETIPVSSIEGKHDWRGAMVVAVPNADGTPWMRRFGDVTTAMASGWMQVRGNRRRRNMDRGFVLSDHVDWPEFLKAIDLCSPDEVWVTHGYSDIASRYLSEQGINAISMETRLGGDQAEAALQQVGQGEADDGTRAP